MKKAYLCLFLLFGSSLAANHDSSFSDEFAEYHLKIAIEEVENEDVFNLIQENVKDLKNRDASDTAANELINLIHEGYKIDSFNMSKLIETLIHKDASNNAATVIIEAIEHNSPISSDHLSSLIKTLAYADASNNAAAVLFKAIEHGIEFGPKERLHLAEASKVVNAKKNVEKIRKALHERALEKGQGLTV